MSSIGRSRPRCYLNALGAVNGLGSDSATIAAALWAGQRGTRAEDGLLSGRTAWVGRVASALPVIAAPRFRTRNNALLAAALTNLGDAAANALARHGAARVGIVLGSSTSGILEGDSALEERRAIGRWPASFDYVQQEVGGPSEFLRSVLGSEGPAYTISTACTSSAKALAAAKRLVDTGICDAVIAGGVDSLCRLTLRGFESLESLDPGPCQPFSRRRRGINVGEAAALFVVSREPGPVVLLGTGETSDAHHISAPDPSGAGAELALRLALADAGANARDIGYLNLHGTATLQNDLMESHAVARVFGVELPCSSTKGLTGHTLGAAGATEAAFCWLSLTSGGMLPAHAWDGERDLELAPLTFVAPGSRARPGSLVASSSFAFGGSNAVLVMGPG